MPTGRPVAVVTGAAHGIGLDAARRLAVTHRVALLDLDADGIRRAAAELGGDALAVECDIAVPASVSAAAGAVLDACGGVDVVVANAGIATSGALRHLDPAVLEAQVRVNLTGTWRSIHAFLPSVIERRGYVLGVASLAALTAAPGLGAYAASKAGLEALLEVLRQEVAHLGVDVGVAYFSWIDTDMVRGAEQAHPDFARMRAELKGPIARTLPVSAAGEAIARGVAERAPRVVAPRWVAAIRRARGVIPGIVQREGRRVAPRIDQATAEMAAERGALAGIRPGHAPSEAAARAVAARDRAAGRS
jgi:NAD(P)-dependent dehydrogenase (short-subunit alcohol dehydrogenase family)